MIVPVHIDNHCVGGGVLTQKRPLRPSIEGQSNRSLNIGVFFFF